MSVPVVSIVMPVRNAARYLNASLQSIRQQSYSDFECVVMDDASTDDSYAIAAAIATEDRRVQVLRKRVPTALGDTRNKLIAASAGALVCCADADDLAAPDRIAKQVAYMGRHPTCVALGGQVQFDDEWGVPFPRQPAQAAEHETIMEQLWRGRGGAIQQPTLCLRRESFDRAGGYDPGLNSSEDLDLYLRLSGVGRLANLPDMLTIMRRHCDSISAVDTRAEAKARVERILTSHAQRQGMTRAYELDWLDEHPRSVDEWYLRNAVCFYRHGQRQHALRHISRALRAKPSNLRCWTLAIEICIPWRFKQRWTRMALSASRTQEGPEV